MLKYKLPTLLSKLLIKLSAAAVILTAFVIGVVLFSITSFLVLFDVKTIYDYFFYWIENPLAGDVIRLNMLLLFTFLVVFNYPSQKSITEAKAFFESDNILYSLFMNFLYLLFVFSPILFVTILIAFVLEQSLLDINNIVAPLIPIVSFLIISLVFISKSSKYIVLTQCQPSI